MKQFFDVRTLLLALILTIVGASFTIANVVVVPLGDSPAPQYRMFYLTKQTAYNGSEPIGACDPGYHMASMFELLNSGGLRYDTSRGFTNADSGEGPPTNVNGWVRTGYFSSESATAGQGNCYTWTSTLSDEDGTVAAIEPSWNNSQLTEEISPWLAGPAGCNIDRNVWCIQDY